MFDSDFLAAPFEVKFASSGEPGTFEGYGSVFGNVDSHGDVVMPGAFSQTLAERKAQGRTIAMHVMHGLFGGDGLPAGVWTDASEDSKGLHLKGKLSGMDTDYGKRLHGLVKDGALGGLSIGFSVPQGGAVKAAQGSGASRQINRVNLHEVSLVDDPSNAASRVTDMKRRFERWGLKTAMIPDKATASIAAAIGLHQASLKGGHPPTQEECDAMLQHLQDAHLALTGAPLALTKKAPFSDDFRRVLDTLSGLGTPSPSLAGFSLPDLTGAAGL
ncbi:HK97 family phage prohead protease [Gluconobacter cerinus]|uniref:HK97 family phage prohead protease n=1 Tax=Gluconobacter cerinus TaxID=38307 RepID=UPI00193EC45F|nr:HK97 family phage prohead protease [Gluconobacter cerinus]MBM3096612.1 HK97 family phage prohead protease [Gluconobacter cerinus]